MSKFCETCGKALAASDEYCSNCGASVITPVPLSSPQVINESQPKSNWQKYRDRRRQTLPIRLLIAAIVIVLILSDKLSNF